MAWSRRALAILLAGVALSASCGAASTARPLDSTSDGPNRPLSSTATDVSGWPVLHGEVVGEATKYEGVGDLIFNLGRGLIAGPVRLSAVASSPGIEVGTFKLMSGDVVEVQVVGLSDSENVTGVATLHFQHVRVSVRDDAASWTVTVGP